MRQVIRFLTATVFGVASFASSAPLFAQQGYVHEVSGTVRGQVGSGQPASVGKGMTLPAGSTVTTEANSYAVLKFEDGTVVLLKENTSFQVQNYSYNPKAPENANAVFNLLRGGLRMITGVLASRNREALRVATPHATIGIRGTEFTAELTNPLFVACQVGAVSLTNAAGTMLVSAGQFASVLTAGQLGALIPKVPTGILNFPNVPLPTAAPLSGPPPSGPGPIGGGAAGGAGAAGTAALVGAAAAAGVAASGSNSSSTTHH